MHHHRIADWDDAYANGPHIPGSDAWPDIWAGPARIMREGLLAQGRARLDVAYGDRPRNRFDLFQPEGRPKGLVVYVHGGFWMRLDKSFWSHLAEGALRKGFAVAIPGYTLCPDVRIRDITVEIAAAIAASAGMVAGPLHLAGHSAGGHLATRMVCAGSPLPAVVQARIAGVLSISGLHDLRPLMATAMNAVLKLDEAEALAESPALLRPTEGARLTCWAGASERAEFVRQNALLANVWRGLGAAVACVEEPDRHHFNVVDGLTDPDHPLTQALLDQD